MTCKFRKEVETDLFVDGLMEKGCYNWCGVGFISFQLKEISVWCFGCFFPPFLKNFDERKTHNVFALMLNPRYKNLIIVSTFFGKELGVGVVK
jgi:cell division protein FtsW (lipid II flippase)